MIQTPTIWLRLTLAWLFFALASLESGCQRKSSTVEARPTVQPSPIATPRPVCPPLGAVLVQPPQSSKGHRVTLTWKPSDVADRKHDAAVGYCIYRGPKAGVITEQVNNLPFPEVKCVDDAVQNGKKYYYVVRAISARAETSDVSRPAPVLIPNTPPTHPPDTSIPLCRAPH